MTYDPLFPTLGTVADAYDDGRDRRGHPTPLQIIMRTVCRKHAVTVKQFLGRQRGRRIVAIRLEAIFLAIDEGESIAEIGRAFNRDQTTIRHAIKKQNSR